MADAIQRLIVNPDARKKMGMHARKLYEEKFTVQKMLENIELLYRGLIKADNINAFKTI
jgi:glycosyltransferase involved in cell wall biosynthesis